MDGKRGKGMEAKIYVVFHRPVREDGSVGSPKILAIRLTSIGARKVFEDNPGSWVERHVATKN
jgi:hypothetical protein